MDEKILYIIFIVLSLAYSAYRKNQKQKAKNSSQPSAASGQQPVASNQQPATSSQQSDMEQRKADRAIKVKTLLDKMLLGEEFTEVSNTKDEAEEIESPKTEVGSQKLDDRSQRLEDRSRKLEDRVRKSEVESRKSEEGIKQYSPTEEEMKQKDLIKAEEIPHRKKVNFNIKQAVINSIILERRY